MPADGCSSICVLLNAMKRGRLDLAISLSVHRNRVQQHHLIEVRGKHKDPPQFTLDLDTLSLERCQETYSIVASRPSRPIRKGEPYFLIRFPVGFRPSSPAIEYKRAYQEITFRCQNGAA